MNLQPRQLHCPAQPIELHKLKLKKLILEISGYDPETATCKVAVLPIETISPFFLSEKRLERSWISSVNLKITLSTYSSTRIYTRIEDSHLYILVMSQRCLLITLIRIFKAKVSWTLMITVMSSILYLLSYSLYNIIYF